MNTVNANSPDALQSSHCTLQIPLMLQLTSFPGNALVYTAVLTMLIIHLH